MTDNNLRPYWHNLIAENIARYLQVGYVVKCRWDDNEVIGEIEEINSDRIWSYWKHDGQEKNCDRSYLVINKGILFCVISTGVKEPRHSDLLDALKYPFITKPNTGIKKFMSDLATKFKMLTLSAEDKLMVENGFKTVDGDYTEKFRSEVEERETAKRAEENKAREKSYETAIIAELKAIAEAEAQKK